MSLKYQCIDHVTLPVTYLKRSVEFYQDVLGMKALDRPETLPHKGAWFAVNDQQRLHLVYSVAAQTEGAHGRRHHVALRVADVEAARRVLVGTGWPIDPIEDLSDGSRRLSLRDPDGHAIELCE